MSKYKLLNIINLFLCVGIILACMGLIVYYHYIGDPLRRISSCVLTSVVCIVPYVCQLIFKRKFSPVMILLYQLYVLVAAFVGSAVGVYKTHGYYDKIIHFLFGYTFNYIGIIIATRVVDKSKHPWFVLLVSFMFTMCSAAIWEVFEFSMDNLFGGTAQGPKVAYGTALVTDTMLDIIMGLGGAMLFAIQYTIHVVCHKNLLIDTTINDWDVHTPTKFSIANSKKDDE